MPQPTPGAPVYAALVQFSVKGKGQIPPFDVTVNYPELTETQAAAVSDVLASKALLTLIDLGYEGSVQGLPKDAGEAVQALRARIRG